MTTADTLRTGQASHRLMRDIENKTGRKPGIQSEIGLVIIRRALNKFLPDDEASMIYKDRILPATRLILFLDEISEKDDGNSNAIQTLNLKGFPDSFKEGLTKVWEAMKGEKEAFLTNDPVRYLEVSSVSSSFDLIMEFAFDFTTTFSPEDLITMRNIFRIFSDASTIGKDIKHGTPNVFLIEGVDRENILRGANDQLEVLVNKNPTDNLAKVGIEILSSLQEIYYYKTTKNILFWGIGFFLRKYYPV